MKHLLLAAILIIPVAACGGGDSGGDGSKSGSTAAGTAGMAAAFTAEITTIQTCVQGQVDGKGDCKTDFLSNPMTLMCSDVSTGRANSFPGADYEKFRPTCASWASVLSQPAAEKLTSLAKMISDLEAVK